MSELKPGDKVWVSAEIIDQPVEAMIDADTGATEWGYYAYGNAWWPELDHNVLGDKDTDSSDVIPDVPNLAAVARVLAAHPGIGEVVQAISELLICERSDISWPNGVELPKGDPNRWEIVLNAAKELNAKRRAVTPEVVEQFRQFAAALNGGTA